MSGRVNVFCVYWEGSFRRRPYSPVWVHRLRDMVARNLAVDHAFYCLSNVQIKGIDVIPLKHNWPGWWSKVELFRSDLPLGRNIYFDLDVLLCGSVEEIVKYPSPIAFHPPGYIVHGKAPSGGFGVVDKYNSSVIVWDTGEGCEFYDLFEEHHMSTFRGDQDWFSWCLPHFPTLPVQWFDRLKYCRAGPKPGVKVILSMPDKNEVASIKHQWVREIWKGVGQ